MHPCTIGAPRSPIFLQTPPLSAVLQPGSGASLTIPRTYQAHSYHRAFGNLFFWVIPPLYSDFCSSMTPRDFTNDACLLFCFLSLFPSDPQGSPLASQVPVLVPRLPLLPQALLGTWFFIYEAAISVQTIISLPPFSLGSSLLFILQPGPI